MINLRQTLSEAHNLLETQKVAHALIGGFALAVYGYHRATADIYLLADGTKKEVIKTAFLAQGYSLKHESSEVLQFSGSGFVDILLANRTLSQQMLVRAKENQPLGVYVVTAEDLIGLKIQAYMNDSSRALQDKADIQKLLALANLDFELIKKYADLFGEWSTIDELRGAKP